MAQVKTIGEAVRNMSVLMANMYYHLTKASINKGTHVGQPAFSVLFALFSLAGDRCACVQKNKNPSKNQGCPMRSSSAGAEMLADKEKTAENTLCILKGFDAV